jgi:hypothetical protein
VSVLVVLTGLWSRADPAPVTWHSCAGMTTCSNMQVKDVRYNINFTVNYTEVAYSYYEYQTFLPKQSCKGCHLDDSFVGINRCR